LGIVILMDVPITQAVTSNWIGIVDIHSLPQYSFKLYLFIPSYKYYLK
jgi:hypothetical protein